MGYNPLDKTFHYDPEGLAKQFDAVFKLADSFASYVLYLRFEIPGAPPLLASSGALDEIVGALTRCLYDDGLIPQQDPLAEYRNFIDPLHASDKRGAPLSMRKLECEREARFLYGFRGPWLSPAITLEP